MKLARTNKFRRVKKPKFLENLNHQEIDAFFTGILFLLLPLFGAVVFASITEEVFRPKKAGYNPGSGVVQVFYFFLGITIQFGTLFAYYSIRGGV